MVEYEVVRDEESEPETVYIDYSFEEKYGRKVDTYVDYRKLVERDDIDAAIPGEVPLVEGCVGCQLLGLEVG